VDSSLVDANASPKTSRLHAGHTIYPYLLRDLAVDRPNQVWAADITYIPLDRGFMFLVVVMDWYSRKVLSWRFSNTLKTDFCLEALEEALFPGSSCPTSGVHFPFSG